LFFTEELLQKTSNHRGLISSIMTVQLWPGLAFPLCVCVCGIH